MVGKGSQQKGQDVGRTGDEHGEGFHANPFVFVIDTKTILACATPTCHLINHEVPHIPRSYPPLPFQEVGG